MQFNDQNAKDKQNEDLSDERTNLALKRTMLALERTVNSWIRTGLAAIAAGLGIPRILGSSSYWLNQIIGAVFITAGIICLVIAVWRYRRGYRSFINRETIMAPISLTFLVALALFFSAILGYVLLFE